MPPTSHDLLSFPPPSDKELQDRIQLYIDGIPDHPALDSVPALDSPFSTPPASTLGSPYATPPPSLVENEEQYTPSPVVVDLHELLVSINMSPTASIAGSSDGINPSVTSDQNNKIGMGDAIGARDGMVTSGAQADEEGKVIDDSNFDTETVIADFPPSQATTGNSHTEKNVRIGAEPSASADVKSPAASSKEGSHVSGMHLSKYAPKPILADWPPQIPRGPRAAKVHNAPRAPRGPQNSGYHGQNQNLGQGNLRDKVRTLENELREARQVLEAERKATEAAVEKAEARTRKYCDIAVRQIISDTLKQKIHNVQQTEALRLIETDLAARKELIRNIEGALTKRQMECTGAANQTVGEFVTVNEEIIRERVAHEMSRRDNIVNARQTIKEQELEAREADLKVREEQAPTIVSSALAKMTAEIRADLKEEMASRMIFANEQQHQDYVQGFSECCEIFTLLKELESGKIAPNDPKVAFLVDPYHPNNPLLRAMMSNQATRSSSAFVPSVNINCGNANQMGRLHGGNATGSRPRQHYRDIYHEDPNSGVPHFGTRTAEPLVPDLAGQTPVRPDAERTPTTTKDNAANDSTPEGREPAHVAVPGFSSVPTPRRTAPDERVHREDKTVDLIDLY